MSDDRRPSVVDSASAPKEDTQATGRGVVDAIGGLNLAAFGGVHGLMAYQSAAPSAGFKFIYLWTGLAVLLGLYISGRYLAESYRRRHKISEVIPLSAAAVLSAIVTCWITLHSYHR